jgi:hypothetical protein
MTGEVTAAAHWRPVQVHQDLGNKSQVYLLLMPFWEKNIEKEIDKKENY